MRRWAECEKGRDRALKWEEEHNKRNEERSLRAGKTMVNVEQRKESSSNGDWDVQVGILALF